MRVKELKKLLEQYNDEDVVVVEVHDTVLHEDLYEFELDNIDFHVDSNGLPERRTEVRICPINHRDEIVVGFYENQES